MLTVEEPVPLRELALRTGQLPSLKGEVADLLDDLQNLGTILDESRLDEMALVEQIDLILESDYLVLYLRLIMVDFLELTVQQLQVRAHRIGVGRIPLEMLLLPINNAVDRFFSKLDFGLECSFLQIQLAHVVIVRIHRECRERVFLFLQPSSMLILVCSQLLFNIIKQWLEAAVVCPDVVCILQRFQRLVPVV